ncbi:hypothetical protein [Streptomyces sp. NPDC002467]|uniref:hypothetical protein n=1 Tax=Streptomyces sp. NPDC002467 TaxID=3364647 RepID=UPI0036AD775F
MTLTLMDSYTLWRRMPFPSGGATEGLRMTYADLAEVDEYLTTVIRFIERGIFKPSPADVPAIVSELMERIDRLCAESSGKDLEVARAQHAYAALMALLYRQFLEAAPAAE